MNRVSLIGLCGKFLNFRELPDGREAVHFSVRTHEYFVNRKGERERTTDWHTISVAPGGYVELVRGLEGGDMVYVEGVLRTRHWVDGEGGKRRASYVVVAGREGRLIKLRRRAEMIGYAETDNAAADEDERQRKLSSEEYF